MAYYDPQYPRQFSESYNPDKLIAGETHIATRSYILLAGQQLQRGTVVGMITVSGKLTTCTTTATDGSQIPFGILIDYYDSTAGDLAGCGVYEKGEFNENAIIFGAAWTIATIHAPLRAVGIWLKPSVTAVAS